MRNNNTGAQINNFNQLRPTNHIADLNCVSRYELSTVKLYHWGVLLDLKSSSDNPLITLDIKLPRSE
jgi:hypothetical protein